MTLLKKMKLTKIGAFVGLLLLGTGAYAQNGVPQMPQDQPPVKEDYSEKELKQFVDVSDEVGKVQVESEKQMMKAIEDEDMKLERFNEIAEAQQARDSSLKASPEELNSFNNAAQNIIKIQQTMQTQIESTIKDKGMEPNKFQEILMAYQRSPKVKQKIDAMIKK